MKKLSGRLTLLGVVLVLSIGFLLPSFPPLYDPLPDWLKKVLPTRGIALGLDLQGGIHLVLEVEEDRAVEIAVDRATNAIQDLLAEKKIPAESVRRTGHIQITITFQNGDLKSQIQTVLEEFPTFYEVQASSTAHSLVYELREGEVKRIKDSAINQALETIRNRIDQFGVAEPLIQRQGLKQIVVQLPGIKEPKRAKELIKETALLEFKMLDESSKLALDLPQRIPKGKEEELLKPFRDKLPEGDEILFEKVVEKDTGREYRVPYLVKKRVMLAGDVLSDARVSIGQFNDPYVLVTFYRLSGLIADFALALNLICLIGVLSGLNATLTLPGIAGIILTIGMGVDSNVLIFERIREELRQGKPVRLAVDGGYDKALLTIIDSHVTTLITGVALFLFGTGPIKGFAVTLCLGIAINLFTALVGTKVVFDAINQRWKVEHLSI